MTEATAFAIGVAFGAIGMLTLAMVNLRFLWKHHQMVIDRNLCARTSTDCEWCKKYNVKDDE